MFIVYCFKMSLCPCVPARLEHHKTFLLVSALGGAVLYIIARFLNNAIFLHSSYSNTCCIIVLQIKTTYHVSCNKLLRQAVKGVTCITTCNLPH